MFIDSFIGFLINTLNTNAIKSNNIDNFPSLTIEKEIEDQANVLRMFHIDNEIDTIYVNVIFK